MRTKSTRQRAENVYINFNVSSQNDSTPLNWLMTEIFEIDMRIYLITSGDIDISNDCHGFQNEVKGCHICKLLKLNSCLQYVQHRSMLSIVMAWSGRWIIQFAVIACAATMIQDDLMSREAFLFLGLCAVISRLFWQRDGNAELYVFQAVS